MILLAPAPAQNTAACTAATTRGTYSVMCTGFLSPAPGAPQLPIWRLWHDRWRLGRQLHRGCQSKPRWNYRRSNRQRHARGGRRLHGFDPHIPRRSTARCAQLEYHCPHSGRRQRNSRHERRSRRQHDLHTTANEPVRPRHGRQFRAVTELWEKTPDNRWFSGRITARKVRSVEQ